MALQIDVEHDGTLVVREIETTRTGVFLTAIMDAARALQAVIQQMELRPRHQGSDTLDARIVVSPDREGAEGTNKWMLVDALLTNLRLADAPAPAPV